MSTRGHRTLCQEHCVLRVVWVGAEHGFGSNHNSCPLLFLDSEISKVNVSPNGAFCCFIKFLIVVVNTNKNIMSNNLDFSPFGCKIQPTIVLLGLLLQPIAFPWWMRNGRRKRNKKSFVEMRKMGRGERICLIMFYQIKFEIIIIILT